MLRWIERIAAGLVLLIGLLHLAVGRRMFFEPTEQGVWFLSAGFLLVTTGLANLARAAEIRPSRLLSATAASGALAILALGALIAAASPELLLAPQTLVLLALGALLGAFSLRDVLRGRR